jgi:hypothetical protein
VEPEDVAQKRRIEKAMVRGSKFHLRRMNRSSCWAEALMAASSMFGNYCMIKQISREGLVVVFAERAALMILE